MARLLFFSLLLTINIFPQIKFSIYGGINPSTASFLTNQKNFLEMYWKDGISTGISSKYNLTSSIILSAAFEVSYYKFDHYQSRLMLIPEIRFMSSTGEDSKVFRFILEGKYFPKTNTPFKFYISTGAAYITESIGDITITYFDMNKNKNITSYRNFESENFIAHTLGIGLQWNISEVFGLDISAKYFSNYYDRFRTSVIAGFYYAIKN